MVPHQTSLGKFPSPLRMRLLHGASALTVLTALSAHPAAAQLAALHGAAHVSSTGTGAPAIAVPVVPGLATSPAQAAAAARQLQNAGKAQQAVNLAQQAQTAARQSLATVPGVADGLAPGGLVPVANPLSAANDPTGLNTWQGANAPTQTANANGSVEVDIQQTASRAVLDWTSFNVGAHTTLNFDQSAGGVAQPGWVVLNRVVGQLDPRTGLRDPSLAPAPSQILGSIKAQGTVLVINQNGIVFGAGSQINTNAFLGTSLEIGSPTFTTNSYNGVALGGNLNVAATIAERDNLFLEDGLLISGSNETFTAQATSQITFKASVATNAVNVIDPTLEGAITVQAGAEITSGPGGYVILAAPAVTNSGVLSATQGQVSLVSGRELTLIPSAGTATSGNDPNIRGLAAASLPDNMGLSGAAFQDDYVQNTATGLIQSSEGYASLVTTPTGTAINAGTITATTSVARNGYIQIAAANIQLAPGSVLAITPLDGATIPQDPNSLADFKPSLISIGGTASGSPINPSVDIASGSLIYAPGATINIGTGAISPSVFIDSGAVIDASGLKNVQVSGAAQLVTISPVTANDTADTPTQRSTLDHTTVTVDPRQSGVRSDGVAWIGSPLIPAQSYVDQIGVSASQLMVKGGNVTIGSQSIVKPGAVIDISGGWVTFTGGRVQTTNLIAADGSVVNIADASPDAVYLGVYNGFTAVQPTFGVATTYANPLLSGGYVEPDYIQGADAGSLTVPAPIALQGTIYAAAYTGPLQAHLAQVGTGTPTVVGDQRNVQAAGSELPVGGFLSIGAGATDFEIVGGSTPATAAGLSFDPTVAPDGQGGLKASSTAFPSLAASPLLLSAPDLSAMGLGQLSVFGTGLKVDADAKLALTPGGVFTATITGAITIDGAITAPSGSISLQTNAPATAVSGQYDVVVNGQLSTAGLWSNDFGASAAGFVGPAYIDGGSISIIVAPHVDSLGATNGGASGDVPTTAASKSGAAPASSTDLSGSILIDGANSLVDVSAGGYVAPDGTINLSGKGGNVSLTDATVYFPFGLGTFGDNGTVRKTGEDPGFRVNGILDATTPVVAANPDSIHARVAIGDGTIRGYGFAGGGTFSLTTPALAFSNGIAATGTNLPLDFFSKAGFATYNITSYATDLIPNAFSNGLGGYNAVLATQVLTVKNGQALDLTQTGYSTHLTGAQIAALRGLASGGDLSSVVAPTIQPDGFDQKPISLNLGGLIEFEVAPGGVVTGAAGASLSAAQINNMGTIRLPGGTLSQSETLPSGYAGRDSLGVTAVATGASLSDIFSTNPDGSVSETAKSLANPSLTNAQLAATTYIYLTGDLPANVGVSLAPGSVTDLSGTVLVNPYAPQATQGRQVVTGRLVDGGALQTSGADLNSTALLFPVQAGANSIAYAAANLVVQQPGLALNAAPGAVIDLSGASGVFDQLTASGQYVQAPQWSNGGALTLGAGGTLTGAVVNAHGGGAQAAGGVLTTAGLALTASDPATPTANTLSAQQIEDAGFGTLVVEGDLTTSGDAPVSLTLAQAFYLTGAPTGTVYLTSTPTAAIINAQQTFYPTVSVAGALQINAPYVSLYGDLQSLQSPTYSPDSANSATGSVTFNSQALDVTGAVLFDQAVAKVAFNVSGDLRFTGVEPLQIAGQVAPPPSLIGQLAVNGDLTMTAAQVYATTGSSFDVTSAAKAGVITIAAAGPTPPPAPYSAGSSLTIQAANIVQDGVIRAPVGSLTLGADTPLVSGGATFAPATASLQLGAGSVTSVSADGLSIPYGTTTDQKEYYFSPNNANPLSAPPAAVLTLAGQSIVTQSGATVDLTGGGDLFAYEFIPGAGGSRDILSQFNADAFTSNGGYQFADHRQVYAIVPGLSNAPTAAYDPIYSSNYAALYAPGSAGQRVYLNGGPGIAAGWYTLLPAQYAVLPGGMEVVEDTSAATVPLGSSSVLKDGAVAVTGEFGGLGGTMQSTPHVFDLKSQAVINSYSEIALTSASASFTALAATNGVTTPRLPADAGRLVINPTTALDLSGTFQTAPGQGGRGSEVDITGAAISIVSQLGTPTAGLIQLSADQLSGLNADSLLIGGVRTDNPDGTTSLNVTAKSIVVANDTAHPLTGPSIVLAADGSGAAITLNDGAAILASGADTTGQTGDYLITGAATGQTGQGALVRVSSGAQRLVTRSNQSPSAQPGVLTVGAATLSGQSVLLDSSGDLHIAPTAVLTASNIALDASSIAFAPNANGTGGLVITPALQASLSKATTLTLRSPSVIDFAAGGYGFGNLDLDAPGVAVAGGTGAVTVSAQAVQLQNSFADAGGCAGAAALACGSGQFALNSQSLTFGDGTFRVYGAGQGVSLSAPGGVFFQGQGVFGVGAAPLTITTPFLGDQTAPDAMIGVAAAMPSLSISTTGALMLTNPNGLAAPTVSGTPGATLTLNGAAITVDGVDVRATAGSLSLNAVSDIAVGAGSTLETPGYSKSFGDAADPYSVSAPGGLLTLASTAGSIRLAPGSTLSVGGSAGAGGALTLNASQGSVVFGGALDGAAPDGGASFALNEGGAFDLAGFLNGAGKAFNGQVIIQTGAGDLTLAAGQTLKAADVTLVADGGRVDVAGTIDVSGVNGGDVGLFGAGGVTLESGALVAARASGYGPTDTRQASGGQVELGTAGTGAITVAAGATIDVSAAQTAPRIVEGEEDGLTTYNYVPADLGGTIVLRAPVSGGDHAETVNVSFAGAAVGAGSIVLEGYKAYDLAAVAGQFSGVSILNGPNGANVATLDTTATGKPNFLADDAPGTLVDFIQAFDISASYGNLGGLAARANFHARPGVELDYSGDITLASNWNLGAGVVNVPGAVAAGLMVADPGVPGAYSVIPGDEAAVLANYTTLTYRVGAAVLGEPGVLTLKAGGQLTVKGSITDGFFTFGDQTNPTYLANAIGAGTTTYNGVLSTACSGSCTTVTAFSPTNTSSNAVAINFPPATGLGNAAAAGAGANLIPYEAAANTPGALGSGAGGAGDPIGSAEIFPVVNTANGPAVVNSWSYQLTGGAALGSASPVRVVAGAPGGVTVQGRDTYSYGGVAGATAFSDTLLFTVGSQKVTADQWLAAELQANPRLTAASLTNFSFAAAPVAIRPQLQALAVSFFSQHPGQYRFNTAVPPTTVATSLGLAAQFLQLVAADWATLKTGYTPPANTAPPPAKTTVTVAPLIRTGTGSITIAAAGDIDLRNGAAPTLLAPAGSATGFQEGGVAVYTAGAPVMPGLVSATDTTTGATVTLDPSAFATPQENIGLFPYGYGVSNPTGGMQGVAGILLSNALYLQGGGDVSLIAGGDVLGRRDAFTQASLARAEADNISQVTVPNAGVNFIGSDDQPWRVGLVGAPDQKVATNILINPQLFTEGVGTLGGGNVTVKAGGDVSDLTIVADTSITTGAAGGGVKAGQVSQGLLTFGGGNIAVTAGGDLLGGRIDVASGVASIDVGGSVASAGTVTLANDASNAAALVIDNTLRLRLTDATVDLTAHGDATLQGVAALGVQNSGLQPILAISDAYASNFYSPNAGVSIVADGSVALADIGTDVLAGQTLTNNARDVAVLPGSLTAIALGGSLTLNGNYGTGENNAVAVLLDPSPTGTLTLAAGADIDPVTLAMLDSEPGATDVFPAVLPDTPFATLLAQHDPTILHRNDPAPNRIYAGGDIDNMILSVPKQTRIGAGRDIVNMMFFGQNLGAADITRIVAGRDITATSLLENAQTFEPGRGIVTSPNQEPTLQGNTFVIGGPGALMLEAGRNLGPFLTSATIDTSNGPESFAGGVLAVGNTWDPNLQPQSANLYVEFGVAKGQDFNALQTYYLNPANTANLPDYLFSETLNADNVYVPDKSQPIYAAPLIAYMQAHEPAALLSALGSTAVTYDQAYQAFAALPALQQRPFLLQVYFNELAQTSVPGPTLDQFQRGYQAVNLLFPSSLGYTANELGGGTNGANSPVPTGDLDLRLATIETQYGGSIDILGPGGRVLAGSTVATAQQAARRFSDAAFLYAGDSKLASNPGGVLAPDNLFGVQTIAGIPAGYEGVLTLRGGAISTFTDGDFVLNQSRLFTEQGGDITMWSSNGDLNAGEGPKSSSNFPPVVVRVDNNAFSQDDEASGVTGAGIAALKLTPDAPSPDVFLIAPRGTVDAGAAGVRVAGNLFVAALHVANADNFTVGGTAIGLPPTSTVVEVPAAASNAAAAVTKMVQDVVARAQAPTAERSIITVEVLGFGDPCTDPNTPCRR